MISLNVHNIKRIKAGKIHKIRGCNSYCRTLKITTDEMDLVEIDLFATNMLDLHFGRICK